MIRKAINLLLLLLFVGATQLYGQTPHKVTLHVSSITQADVEGLPVTIKNLSFGLVYPNKSLAADGTCKLTGIYDGEHMLTIDGRSMGLEYYVDEHLQISSDTTLTIVLQEEITTPYGLKTSQYHNPHSGATDVVCHWNDENDYFFEDFESYEDFAIDFAPWTGIDGDKLNTAKLTGSYSNSSLPQYATIFNPLTIDPPVWYDYPVLRPYSGKQYAAFIRTESGAANNDWLISPQIEVRSNNVLRFMAKAGDTYKERFKVAISTTGTEMGDFTFLTPGNYESVSYDKWRQMEYDLSLYQGKKVYIAIQYISTGFFMLMVDDFYVGPASQNPSLQSKRLGAKATTSSSEMHQIYLDGAFVGETAANSYVFENVAAGAHTVGVKTKYIVSESPLATTEFTVKDASHFSSITTHVVSNNEKSVEGASLVYTHIDSGTDIADELTSEGTSTFESLEKGNYLIHLEKPGYLPVDTLLTLDAPITLNLTLREEIVTPYNITTTITPDAASETNSVAVRWNQDLGFTDGFETYADFSASFGEWTCIDDDQSLPYGISFNGSMISYPYSDAPAAGLIFNPYRTTPSLAQDGNMLAPEGSKYVMFRSAQMAATSDWLIAPKQKIEDGYVVRFTAKSYDGNYLEDLQIMASESKETISFEQLDYITLPNDWMRYEIDLSAYQGKEIYVAFHYVSVDKFVMQLDDVYIGPGKENDAATSGDATYLVSLDGKEVATTTTTSCTLTGVANGEHTLSIQASYASGLSDITNYTFTCGLVGVESTTVEGCAAYAAAGGIQVVNPTQEACAVTIYTTTGAAVYSAALEGSEQLIALPAGLYLVEMQTATGVIRTKVLVQ